MHAVGGALEGHHLEGGAVPHLVRVRAKVRVRARARVRVRVRVRVRFRVVPHLLLLDRRLDDVQVGLIVHEEELAPGVGERGGRAV